MAITPPRRHSNSIALISILVSLGLLIFSIYSHTRADEATRQASTAQAEKTNALEQMETAQARAEEAKIQAMISRANELAAESSAVRDTNLQRAMLLGIEAYQINENVRTKSALFDNARTNPQIQLFLSGHTKEVRSAAFNVGGSMLATGGFDGIILWDVKTGQIIRKIEWDVEFVTHLVFSHDGNTLASISNGYAIAIWNVSNGKLIEKQPPGIGAINVSFSPDGTTLALGMCSSHPIFSPCVVDKTILWNMTAGQIIETIEYGAPVISFSPDGNILALTGKEKNSVILWDIKNHQVSKELFTAYPISENNLMFFANGNLLAGDRIWDINTGQPISQPLHITHESVFSPDGSTMFTASWGYIDQLDIETGSVGLFAQLSDQYSIQIFAVNPDGTLLAIWGKDRKSVILVSKYQPDQPYQSLGMFLPESELPELADLDFGTIVYSPDKGIKASIDFKNDVIVLSDAQSGAEIRTLDTEGAHLWEKIIFSPDGKTLASIEYLAMILWDVESGQPIGAPLPKMGSEIEFTATGNLLVMTRQGRFFLWDINPRSWIEQTCRRVGRNLTALEWKKYFPGEEYRVTCPQWEPAQW